MNDEQGIMFGFCFCFLFFPIIIIIIIFFFIFFFFFSFIIAVEQRWISFLYCTKAFLRIPVSPWQDLMCGHQASCHILAETPVSKFRTKNLVTTLASERSTSFSGWKPPRRLRHLATKQRQNVAFIAVVCRTHVRMHSCLNSDRLHQLQASTFDLRHLPTSALQIRKMKICCRQASPALPEQT